MTKKFEQELFSVVIATINENTTKNATCDCYYNENKKQLMLSFKQEKIKNEGRWTSTQVELFHPLNWLLAIGEPMARYSAKKCQAIFDSLDKEKLKDFYLANRSETNRFNQLENAQEIWGLLP